MYSGPQRITGLYVTGFLSKNIISSILEFEAINENICRLKLKVKFSNTSITILSWYTPQEERTDVDK